MCVCGCVCMYVCVCIFVCMYVCMYVCVYVCLYIYTYIYIYIYIYYHHHHPCATIVSSGWGKHQHAASTSACLALSSARCSIVTFGYVALLGECCSSGRDSSLNLLVLGFFAGALYLSHADVTCNVLDLSVVDIYWCVIFHYQLCFRPARFQNLIFTFIS